MELWYGVRLAAHSHMMNGTEWAVLKYIQQNPERFELGADYDTNDVKKSVVEHYLKQYVNTVRSNLRSAIWDSIKDKLMLESFAHKIAETYWYPKPPKTIPEAQLAQIALMCVIALPLTKIKFAKGADTGFWTLLEKKLDELMKNLGKDRNKPTWDVWYKTIVEEERQLISHGFENPSLQGDGDDTNDGANEPLVDA